MGRERQGGHRGDAGTGGAWPEAEPWRGREGWRSEAGTLENTCLLFPRVRTVPTASGFVGTDTMAELVHHRQCWPSGESSGVPSSRDRTPLQSQVSLQAIRVTPEARVSHMGSQQNGNCTGTPRDVYKT